MLQKLGKLEAEIFGAQAIGEKAFVAVHPKGDGVFALIDNNEPIGFIDIIYLSDEQMSQYLKTHNYKTLENIGLKKGKNNLYFFSLALKKEFHGGGCVKLLAKEFAIYLDKAMKTPGVEVSNVFTEAVTPAGAHSVTQSMGMIPINKNEIDKQGLGFYYSPDCLRSYVKKTIQAAEKSFF